MVLDCDELVSVKEISGNQHELWIKWCSKHDFPAPASPTIKVNTQKQKKYHAITDNYKFH